MKLFDLARYGGTSDPEALNALSNDLMRCMKDINLVLGEKKPLLIQYIYSVLTALNHVNNSSVIAEASEDAVSDLRSLCSSVRDGSGSDHPFYPALQQYINNHPCPAESVYVDYYSAAISQEYAAFLLNRHVENSEAAISELLTGQETAAIENELEKLVGPAKLEELRVLIYRRLIVVPSSRLLLQHIADQLIFNLITQDNESGRYVFQMMFE